MYVLDLVLDLGALVLAD